MFVSGPVGTSVIASSAPLSVSARNSTAWRLSGHRLGGGRSGPSSPDSPCTYAAV